MINLAITLLISATTLLGLASSTPDLSSEYRQSIFDTAANAIVFAQTVIDFENQQHVQPVQPIQLPSSLNVTSTPSKAMVVDQPATQSTTTPLTTPSKKPSNPFPMNNLRVNP